MIDRPTSRDVFIQAVEDELNGTPHAHHPVQFEETWVPMMCCTLCHAAVPVNRQDEHRQWHDVHVAAHDKIMDQARQYVWPPRYG